MNVSAADLKNYRTEFHETWWSYRYMFLVDPKVFRFVVKGVKAIFLGVQRGGGGVQASTLTYFSTCPFGQLTKKSTCLTQSFSCPKELIKITKTRE